MNKKYIITILVTVVLIAVLFTVYMSVVNNKSEQVNGIPKKGNSLLIDMEKEEKAIQDNTNNGVKQLNEKYENTGNVTFSSGENVKSENPFNKAKAATSTESASSNKQTEKAEPGIEYTGTLSETGSSKETGVKVDGKEKTESKDAVTFESKSDAEVKEGGVEFGESNVSFQ